MYHPDGGDKGFNINFAFLREFKGDRELQHTRTEILGRHVDSRCPVSQSALANTTVLTKVINNDRQFFPILYFPT